MKASFELMGRRMRSLLKATGWSVALCALFSALTIYFRMPNKALHDWGIESPMAAFVLQTVVYVLTVLSSFVVGATVWSWINKRPLLHNLWRYTAVSVVAAVSALTVILCIPFAYVVPSIMLKEKGEKLQAWAAYKTGFRHFGSLLMIYFLGLLIIAVISCIIFLPAIILGGAQLMSQLGALDGDPLGVPGYFTPLFILVLTLIVFISNYMSMWLDLTFVYLYGSVEAQQEEKNKQLRLEKHEISDRNTEL